MYCHYCKDVLCENGAVVENSFENRKFNVVFAKLLNNEGSVHSRVLYEFRSYFYWDEAFQSFHSNKLTR